MQLKKQALKKNYNRDIYENIVYIVLEKHNV